MTDSVGFAIRAAAVALAFALLFAWFGPGIRKDVPYVATPEPVVRQMLDMAQAGPQDIVYDLGSGDGRIVITALVEYGVRKGIGVDIDPARVRESRDNARAAGVASRAAFHEGDVFEFDFSDATVLTLYLLPEINQRLRPRILGELRPGTRVVSHQFDMGDWHPDARYESRHHDVYLWTVPAKVAGNWTGSLKGDPLQLALRQQYQEVTGMLRFAGRELVIQHGWLAGQRLTADLVASDGTALRLEAAFDGNRVRARLDGESVVLSRQASRIGG